MFSCCQLTSFQEEELKDVAKDIANSEQDAIVKRNEEASTSQVPPKNLDVKDSLNTERDVEVDTIIKTSKSKEDNSSQPSSNDDIHIDDKETDVKELIPVDNNGTSKAPASSKTSSNNTKSTNDDVKDANNTKNDKVVVSKNVASVCQESSSSQPSSNVATTNPQDVTNETSNTAVKSVEGTSTSKVANDKNNNENGSSPLQATTPRQLNVPKQSDKSFKGLSEANKIASDGVDDNNDEAENVDDNAEIDSSKEANNNVQSSDKK